MKKLFLLKKLNLFTQHSSSLLLEWLWHLWILVNVVINWDNDLETHTFTASSGGTYYVVMYEATGIANAISSYSTTISATPSSVEDWDLY